MPQNYPSLAQMARENPDQYRGMSVPQRLDSLQGQMQQGALGQDDQMLLTLLRQRREREGYSGPPAASAQKQDSGLMGLLSRLFSASQKANPFGLVSDELSRVNNGNR